MVDDRSQDDLVDDGLIRRVAGGSAARAWVAHEQFLLPSDCSWICRARVGGPLPGPKTTEGMREFSRQPDSRNFVVCRPGLGPMRPMRRSDGLVGGGLDNRQPRAPGLAGGLDPCVT